MGKFVRREEHPRPAPPRPEPSQATPPRPQAAGGPRGGATQRETESSTSLSHDEIAVRAYELWQSQGAPHGNDWGNWFEAQRQLLQGHHTGTRQATRARM